MYRYQFYSRTGTYSHLKVPFFLYISVCGAGKNTICAGFSFSGTYSADLYVSLGL